MYVRTGIWVPETTYFLTAERTKICLEFIIFYRIYLLKMFLIGKGKDWSRGVLEFEVFENKDTLSVNTYLMLLTVVNLDCKEAPYCMTRNLS